MGSGFIWAQLWYLDRRYKPVSGIGLPALGRLGAKARECVHVEVQLDALSVLDEGWLDGAGVDEKLGGWRPCAPFGTLEVALLEVRLASEAPTGRRAARQQAKHLAVHLRQHLLMLPKCVHLAVVHDLERPLGHNGPRDCGGRDALRAQGRLQGRSSGRGRELLLGQGPRQRLHACACDSERRGQTCQA